ncbi:MAG: hypothetical protein K9J37_09805 [Saprospiraceae bacterium]|nr:hypothetical protein [Saprospiraceae bacterium]MCF8250198.1 hypothetical protein [Saprospiraceae bacterium]MCF8280039.1 hypothetical protein [Bacteroidales bacterium]MCF8312006.1 hypothetical protein [Saprospiraceae bacterium]MCF8441103.1 hypothetical protein [Saprospiraceae bacterium]
MKPIALLVCLLFSSFAMAQEAGKDIVYLKSGMVLRGKIMERMDDGAIKMVTNEGRETIVSFREIKNITIEGVGTNPTDYGSDSAIGLLLRGEGGIGVSYRIKFQKDTWADLNVQPDLRVLINKYTDKIVLSPGINLGAEMDFFIKRFYKERKQRVRANGIFFRGVTALNKYPVTTVSFGWCSEYFRLNNFKRSFMLNLGPGMQINHWFDDSKNSAYTENIYKYMPTVMFKVQWHFFQ